ncbi:hypothetical protein Q7P36_005019 [Cladosporium allicinum]
MGFSNGVPAHDRDSPPISPSSVCAEIAATHVLDRIDPGQMIQVYSEDQSNVKSSRTDLRHLTRAEADIEFTLDASRYGQDATTGRAVLKSLRGLAWYRLGYRHATRRLSQAAMASMATTAIAYRHTQASGALSALSFRFEKFR